MGKLLRFIAFMAPLVFGALVGNALAVRIWPDLKEKSPWFWLATGANGALGGILATRLLFGKRPSKKPVQKTDPVIPEAPADPKTYEEWRKDLARTVDENAPDFMPLDEFVRKWSDVPRSPKPPPKNDDDRVSREYLDKVMDAMAAARPTPATAPVPNVVGAPDNIIKYVQKEARENGAVDPFAGAPPEIGQMSIRVLESGMSFHRGSAGPVHFYCDAQRLRLDGVEYAVPQGGTLVITVPAGYHFVQALPLTFLSSHAAPQQPYPPPTTCAGYTSLPPAITPAPLFRQ